MKSHFIPLLESSGRKTNDILNTFCHHIAHQIETEVKKSTLQSSKVSKIFITGGGAYNDYLIHALKERLISKTELILPSDEIIQFKEAILMALMGFLRIEQVPNVLSSATGADRDHIAGFIHESELNNL